MDLEISALVEREKELVKRAKEAEAASSKLTVSKEEESRMAELRVAIEAHRQALSKAHMASADIAADVKRIEKSILDVGGVRLKAARAKVSGISEELQMATTDVTKAKASAQSGQKALDRQEKALHKAEGEARAMVEEFNVKDKEFKQIEEDARAVLEAFHTAETEMATRHVEVQEVSEQYEALKKSVATIRTVEQDIENQMEEHKRTLGKNRGAVDALTDKLAKLVASRADDPLRAEAFNIPTLSEDDLAKVAKEEVQYSITMLEEGIQKLNPNMSAIAEYKRKEEDYRLKMGELEEVTGRRDLLRKDYDDLRKRR
jgi:structural maintenance of chromosome 4